MKHVAVCLVCASAAIAPSAAAQELGRLFFSPAERAQLEAQRKSKRVEREATPPAPARIDGYVRPASGRTTVWVNGGMSVDRGVAESQRVRQ